MKKQKVINLRSGSYLFPGQGVGSAFLEHCKMCKSLPADKFCVRVNSLKYADVVHCHSVEPWNLFYMKFMCRQGVMHCHFLPSTLEGSLQLPKLFSKIFNSYVVHFYKSADRIVVVNPSFIPELVELGIAREKITYIPNYVTGEEFRPLEVNEVQKIREKLNIPKDALVVLGVGQIMGRKGVDDFINLAQRMADVKFIWCGGFPFGTMTDDYSNWKEKVKNHPENLLFTGIIPRGQMNEYYNACNCFLLPSHDELFPMCILEAAKVGRPILLRNLELYGDILSGCFAKADSVEEFEFQIRRIQSEPNYNETLCRKSLGINETYSKENILAQLEDFYR